MSITAQLEDLSQVEKYVMSDEDYDQLPVSMRKFLTNLKENNPELFTTKTIITDPDYQRDIAEGYNLGDRCEVIAEEKDDRYRGEIKYIGKIPDLGDGYYIGIQLDEPYGMNNGSYKGVPYFESPSKYGLFKR
jgi:tubulin-folding cofactor B